MSLALFKFRYVFVFHKFNNGVVKTPKRRCLLSLVFVAVCKTVLYCKWFEPRSISSLLSVIVRVSVLLKRTVVVDID